VTWAVPGLLREAWTGATYTDDEFRELAEVLPERAAHGLGRPRGTDLERTGDHGDGVRRSAPTTSRSMPWRRARASLNLRVHPRQNPEEAQRALVEHLRAPTARSDSSSTSPQARSAPVSRRRATDRRTRRRERRWRPRGGASRSQMAGGGSIPLVMALHEAVPDAEILLFGATDSYANIHAPNERVLIDELERSLDLQGALLRGVRSARRPLVSESRQDVRQTSTPSNTAGGEAPGRSRTAGHRRQEAIRVPERRHGARVGARLRLGTHAGDPRGQLRRRRGRRSRSRGRTSGSTRRSASAIASCSWSGRRSTGPTGSRTAPGSWTPRWSASCSLGGRRAVHLRARHLHLGELRDEEPRRRRRRARRPTARPRVAPDRGDHDLFSLLGSTMGFSVETFGFYALFIPLMASIATTG
jgi:hypothetical protein